MNDIESHLKEENNELNAKITALDNMLESKGCVSKTAFVCPSCNYQTKYKPLTNSDFEDVCPNCFITTQETITLQEIKENLNKNDKVLQLSAKEGLYNYFINTLNSKEQYVTISDTEDAFNNKIEDYSKTSFDKDTFDLIVAIHIIDQRKNDKEILKELHRILKNNGKLIIKANADFELTKTVYADYIDTEKLKRYFYGNPYALRNYGSDLIAKIEEIGFNVEYKDPATLPTNKLTRGQLTLDPILVCTKKKKSLFKRLFS